MASSLHRPLALTMGDVCGIGPEIIAAWLRSADAGNAFVVGDVAVVGALVAVAADPNFRTCSPPRSGGEHVAPT